jgi:hypothetical protein
MKPRLKASRSTRLKLKYGQLLSSFAFKFKLRRYMKGVDLNQLTSGVHSVEALTLVKEHLMVGQSAPPAQISPLFNRAGAWDRFRLWAFSQGVLLRGSDFLGSSDSISRLSGRLGQCDPDVIWHPGDAARIIPYV